MLRACNFFPLNIVSALRFLNTCANFLRFLNTRVLSSCTQMWTPWVLIARLYFCVSLAPELRFFIPCFFVFADFLLGVETLGANCTPLHPWVLIARLYFCVSFTPGLRIFIPCFFVFAVQKTLVNLWCLLEISRVQLFSFGVCSRLHVVLPSRGANFLRFLNTRVLISYTQMC